MKITPDDYMNAAKARSVVARILHKNGKYADAIFIAGLCVENILRAYITRIDKVFDERQDLSGLYKKSQIESFIHPKDRRFINASLGDVWTRWKNNYRYTDDARLRSEFNKLQLYTNIQGDILKKNSEICINAALEIYTKGEQRWNSKKNWSQH